MEWTEIEREQFGVGFVLRVGVVVVFRGLFSSIQCFGIEVSQSGRRKEGKLWCREWNCCWALVLGKKDIVDEVDGSRHQPGMGDGMWMNDDSGLRDSRTVVFTVRGYMGIRTQIRVLLLFLFKMFWI